MRLGRVAVATFAILLPLVFSPARAYDLPYDPYPWCAVYSGDGGGTNCGFLTLELCRATVSGIGGFCAHNQFYNPGRPAARTRTRAPR
jgi:hypothetical protein